MADDGLRAAALRAAAHTYQQHLEDGGDPAQGIRLISRTHGYFTARRFASGPREAIPDSLDARAAEKYQDSLRDAWRQYTQNINDKMQPRLPERP